MIHNCRQKCIQNIVYFNLFELINLNETLKI